MVLGDGRGLCHVTVAVSIHPADLQQYFYRYFMSHLNWHHKLHYLPLKFEFLFLHAVQTIIRLQLAPIFLLLGSSEL